MESVIVRRDGREMLGSCSGHVAGGVTMVKLEECGQEIPVSPSDVRPQLGEEARVAEIRAASDAARSAIEGLRKEFWAGGGKVVYTQ